jgi:tRNA(adenine34) deaminase
MPCHHPCTSNPASAVISRRSVVAVVASTAVISAAPFVAARAATQVSADAATQVSADDERYMSLALDEARQGDFPFGAVIVREGRVLARGRNLGRTNGDPTAHGEMIAIRRCLADHGEAALEGSTLYTSGEPCAMCMGAILWCRIGRLVFAASVQQIATKMDDIMISSAELAAKAPFLPITITGGVLANQAMQLLAK